MINILVDRDTVMKEAWKKLVGQKNIFTASDNLYLFKIPKNIFPSVVN